MQVPGQQPGSLFLPQAAFQVHIVPHLIPLDVEARPVGAEYGIRGVVHIRFRVVASFRDHRFGVVAGGVAVESQLQAAQPLGVGRQGLGIVLHLGGGHQPPEGGQAAAGLRGLKLPAHGPDVGDAPANLLRGHRENKVVPGLQQHGSGLHQPLPHRSVGGLPEIPALGVLEMGFSNQQGDFHVRNGRAGEDAFVGFFRQMGQNQLLIISIQHIRGAYRVEHQSAAPGQGFQQQVHLGIVAQGFKMTYALHGIFNGLLIENPPVVQRYVQAKALLHQRLKDFQLHPAHDLHMDLAVLPQKLQLGLFLFQQPQLGQHHRRIRARGKAYPVGHHRLQRTFLPFRFRSQGLARIGLGQARHRDQFPRFRNFRGREFVAGVGAQLKNLFFHTFTFGIFVSQRGAHLDLSAGDFHPGQAISLRIMRNFIGLCRKFLGIRLDWGVNVQNFQKLLHALQLQRGTEAAGKQLPLFNQAPEVSLRDHAGFQIGFQQRLIAQGGVFRYFLKILPKIHTSRGQLPVKRFQKLPFFHRGQVHFVDEEEGGHLIPFQQPPQGQGVSLHSVGAADDQDRAV